jgi:hypothetical protein
MAGLLLNYTGAPKRPDNKSNAIIVNLAPYFVSGYWRCGSIELAWAKPRADRGWFRLAEPQRWLVIEGHPDRLPNPDEPISTWLESRRGSFRGLEVRWSLASGPACITAFVDPWASRPLYYSSVGDTLVIADKVATVAANQENAEVDWAPVLEAMLCGSVYSAGVSLKHTTALRPGEEVRFVGTKYRDSSTRPIPSDPDIDEGVVRSNPVNALCRAVAKSVSDTWREPDIHLLLTGGLDSRFLLALGGSGRHAIHVNINPNETKHTREIAAAADNCHLREFDLPEGHYQRVIERAYLLTGAMFDSRFAWQLGLGAKWQESDIAATLNGYLFDTLLKGYFFIPYQKYPYRDSVVFSLLGPLANSMRGCNGRFSGSAADRVLNLLKPEAQQLGKQRLRRLPDIFPQVITDGVDLSFEILVLSNINRQVHYPIQLGWFEETEAYTPVFHPALWSWYAASSVNDRREGRALRQALASLKHAVCRIPEASTGLPIGNVPKTHLSERLGLRNYFALSRLRDSFRRGRQIDAEPMTTPAGLSIRTAWGLKLIREWVDRTRNHPIFDANGLDRAWSAFEAGDDRAGETLLIMIGARQWEELVKHHDSTDAFRYRVAAEAEGVSF